MTWSLDCISSFLSTEFLRIDIGAKPGFHRIEISAKQFCGGSPKSRFCGPTILKHFFHKNQAEINTKIGHLCRILLNISAPFWDILSNREISPSHSIVRKWGFSKNISARFPLALRASEALGLGEALKAWGHGPHWMRFWKKIRGCICGLEGAYATMVVESFENSSENIMITNSI